MFTELFGGATKIPSNVCPACYDINQDIAKHFNISGTEAFNKSREEIILPTVIDGSKHNALYDAKVIKEVYSIVNA